MQTDFKKVQRTTHPKTFLSNTADSFKAWFMDHLKYPLIYRSLPMQLGSKLWPCLLPAPTFALSKLSCPQLACSHSIFNVFCGSNWSNRAQMAQIRLLGHPKQPCHLLEKTPVRHILWSQNGHFQVILGLGGVQIGLRWTGTPCS